MSDPSSTVDPGDTTWMLTSSALVLTMSPALAMFEAGLLRSKNTLSIFTQVFTGLIVLSTLWFVVGYSLVFGESGGIIGNPFQHALFIDVSYSQPSVHAPRIPAAVFAIFQLTFAVITPLLITGAYAERLPFKVFIAFSVLFSLFVYYPVAHAIWGRGFLEQLGTLDFAGGIVLHTTAGVAALVSAIMIGPRKDFALYHGEFPPSNVPLAAIGCGLLWLGWFGFNGGSAFSATGGIAVSACVSTQIGAVSSGFVWLVGSWWLSKPSSSALMNGLVAGLAGVTPASGYINSPASLLLGLILGVASFGGVQVLKHRLHIDDALEVSVVHGLTGMIGALYIGLFSQRAVNPDGADGWLYGSGRLMWVQLVAVLVAAVWSAVMTFAILTACRMVFGSIRVSEEEEEVGLDWGSHGEVAYHKLQVLEEWERHQAAFSHFPRSEREAGFEEEQRRRKQQKGKKPRVKAAPPTIDETDDEVKEGPAPVLSINVQPVRKGKKKHRGPGELTSPFLSGSRSESSFIPPRNDAYRMQEVQQNGKQ